MNRMVSWKFLTELENKKIQTEMKNTVSKNKLEGMHSRRQKQQIDDLEDKVVEISCSEQGGGWKQTKKGDTSAIRKEKEIQI